MCRLSHQILDVCTKILPSKNSKDQNLREEGKCRLTRTPLETIMVVDLRTDVDGDAKFVDHVDLQEHLQHDLSAVVIVEIRVDKVKVEQLVVVRWL